MTKVTYLFGAGGSALALPTVAAMPERLFQFRQKLVQGDGLSEEFRAVRDSIVKKVNRVLEEVIELSVYEKHKQVILKHASIDTYAKKLFIRGHSDQQLDDLKLVLTLFFMFEQEDKRVDMRYDSFFASIIRDASKRLPSSVKIISWNYDLQFELAFREFTGDGLKSTNDVLRVMTKGFPTVNYMPPTGNDFGIFKINGTAAFFDKKTNSQRHYLREANNTNVYNLICKIKNAYDHGDMINGLSFSWEDPDQNITNQIKEATSDSQVLVLIGYSIPFFNREVDKEIIGNMPLRKVYIQDLNPHPVKERFDSILTDVKPIVMKNNVDQFILPDELSL